MSQLPVDCLNEIFEYLENDQFTLHSCILVNRSCCEISVRIFWRSVWNYNVSNFSTLVACLPNESKEVLYENGIIISTPTSKSPTFNYASFCRVLSINRVHYMIEKLLKNQQSLISSQNLNNNANIIMQEICKMFMNQISSLKNLTILPRQYITFTYHSEIKDCLKNLSKLHCNSRISSEFFYHLSQICHNIQSLTIEFEEIISNGLTDLISAQKNLKCFSIILRGNLTYGDLKKIIHSLMTKLPNTLIKFDMYGECFYFSLFSLSFITNFKSLQELELTFNFTSDFRDFEKLHVTFPQLQILRFKYALPRVLLLIKFLEINGK